MRLLKTNKIDDGGVYQDYFCRTTVSLSICIEVSFYSLGSGVLMLSLCASNYSNYMIEF